jgi:hypothetical protein
MSCKKAAAAIEMAAVVLISLRGAMDRQALGERLFVMSVRSA